jgi:hypothetical protein
MNQHTKIEKKAPDSFSNMFSNVCAEYSNQCLALELRASILLQLKVCIVSAAHFLKQINVTSLVSTHLSFQTKPLDRSNILFVGLYEHDKK